MFASEFPSSLTMAENVLKHLSVYMLDTARGFQCDRKAMYTHTNGTAMSPCRPASASSRPTKWRTTE